MPSFHEVFRSTGPSNDRPRHSISPSVEGFEPRRLLSVAGLATAPVVTAPVEVGPVQPIGHEGGESLAIDGTRVVAIGVATCGSSSTFRADTDIVSAALDELTDETSSTGSECDIGSTLGKVSW